MPMMLNAPDSYSGNLVFNSEEDYAKFKQVVVDSKAHWGDGYSSIQALSSNPPILVKFNNVMVDHSYRFPYGSKAEGWVEPLVAYSMLLVIAIMTAWAAIDSTFKNGGFWMFRKEKDVK